MTKPYFITSSDALDRFHWRQGAHYNMGYERDADGKYKPEPTRHMGYGYGYTCDECPRLYLIQRIMTPKGDYREWYVDGDRYPMSLERAIILLERPPILSLTAFWCLLRLRAMPKDGDPDVWVTGHRNPTDGFIDVGTRYSVWSSARHELTRKGYITYRDGEMAVDV